MPTFVTNPFIMTTNCFRSLALASIATFLLISCASAQTKAQAVDLGLSVMWADINIGADCDTDFGWYLAWGETREKDHYNFDNYKYSEEGKGQSTIDIGSEISGTSYDMATSLWGQVWRLPTEEEMEELIESCEWRWTEKDDVMGVSVKGPNGNSIFLPAGGQDGKESNSGVLCAYWTGSISYGGIGRTAMSLFCYYDYEDEKTTLRTFGVYKVNGLLVRPVMDKVLTVEHH